MPQRRIAKPIGLMVCAALSFAQTIARADVIGAERFIEVTDRRATLAGIHAVLAREEVRHELERLGVDPEDAVARVAALSDQELAVLAEDFEKLPAGGGLLGTIGVVFVVLLILELVGVIDIFKKI